MKNKNHIEYKFYTRINVLLHLTHYIIDLLNNSSIKKYVINICLL